MWWTATYDLKFSVLKSENIIATVVLTLSSHGGKRLRPFHRIFFRNLSGCWRFSSSTCRLLCLQQLFGLFKHHFEHRYHPCDKENRVVAKTFENIITEPGCLRCWSWFVGSTAIHFLFGLLAAITFFCISSLFNVVTISVDRFLAVHLHLRYQELVTHKRVIAAVISIWLFSAIISSSVFWNQLLVSLQVVQLVIITVCLIVVVIVYWRIYIVLKRHKIQIEGLQIQELQQGVQNGDLSNFLKLRKSALGTFYVCILFLICYLPFYILSFLLMARLLSPISLYEARLYATIFVFLNSSLNPVIYCWKMKPIRRTLMDIMRGIVNRFWE